jgi:FKBP-type peptidyl-prolyl cis-trans isomerase SlyD
MQIAKDSVVQFHYTVSEPGQAPIESSHGGDALAILVGHGGIIAGLEKALIGRVAGDSFEVTVQPAEAYGERQEGLVQRVPKKYLRDAERLKPGMQTRVQTREGQRLATVLKVGMSVIDLDMNHPMAGRTLSFQVEIVDVRAASAEEIEHGHAHAPGGHHH